MANVSLDQPFSAVLALRAPASLTLPEIAGALCDKIAGLAMAPAISRAVVSVADIDPGGARWVRPGEQPEGRAYDGLVELTASKDAFSGVVDAALAAIQPFSDAVHAWRVTRLPARLEPRRPVAGGPGTSIKYVVLCNFHADLSDSAARRSWDHHVPLALRIHEGASRYIRSWMEERLTLQSPSFGGMTELVFPTRGDMEQRWFGSDYARAEIIQDIGHFLQSGVRLYTSEYVLKNNAP